VKTAAKYVVSVVLIVVILFFAPIVPTAVLFAWSSVSKEDSRNRSSLTASDLESVVRLIKDHKMFGVREGLPTAVSLGNLLVANESFGILDIKETVPGTFERCPECSLVVITGHICGGLCGAGTEFYLLQRRGQWEIRGFSLWVS
jgi:hypothetical protein